MLFCLQILYPLAQWTNSGTNEEPLLVIHMKIAVFTGEIVASHMHNNMMKQWHSIADVWSLMRQHEGLFLSDLQNHSGAHY